MQRSEMDIRKRLEQAHLPTMPQILLKLIEQCQDEDAGMPELAALISQDAGMASTILAVANSPAYHRSGGRKANLDQALMAIGTDMIKTLVISESVFQMFNDFSKPGTLDLRGFWKHSLTAAVMARDIAVKMKHGHVEEAYLAGLLHDVGRLGLMAAAPQEYAVNFHAKDDAKLCWVEQRTLQITHAEAGAAIIERWQMDSFLADAVQYHHEPVARVASAHPLIRIVMLAHLMSSPDTDAETLVEAGSLCGLVADDIEEIRSKAEIKVTRAAAALGIDLAGADDLAQQAAYVPPQPTAPRNPTQEKMDEEMRNMVLASNASRFFAKQTDIAGLMETISGSARILFGFSEAFLLMADKSGQSLVGKPGNGQAERLAEFSVPLAEGGLIADAALMRKIAFLRRDGDLLTLPEEQLLGLLRADCLICLPMTVSGRCIGMLVGSIGDYQAAELQRRDRFLLAYASQAAAAVQVASSNQAEMDNRIASVTDQYQAATRRVAHEVNNPLTIIKNYLGILDSRLRKQDIVVGEVAILNEEIDRVGQIVHGLTDLEPAATGPAAEVGRVVRDVVRLFRDTEYVPASITIRTDLQEDETVLDGSADLLKQVLMNLLKNAVEALTNGGEIEIIDYGQVNRDGRLFAELRVSDNGPGIPRDILPRLFSPVASSKGGPGRGLGLSIVHSLVQKLGGTITCRSGSRGTSFDLLLPLAFPPSPPGQGQASQNGQRAL
jgi:putative nucleotidyltransferase with HDIG domain